LIGVTRLQSLERADFVAAVLEPTGIIVMEGTRGSRYANGFPQIGVLFIVNLGDLDLSPIGRRHPEKTPLLVVLIDERGVAGVDLLDEVSGAVVFGELGQARFRVPFFTQQVGAVFV